MKKLLLIIAVISIIACVLSLLFSALNHHGYYNLLDGDGDMYVSMRRRMVISFVIGIVFAAIGIACVVVRAKM